MGLINSVAVIALMTNCSYGSGWIPYEFGRVTTGGPFAREASTCLRELNRPLHDYMILAPQINYANGQYQGLDDWLDPPLNAPLPQLEDTLSTFTPPPTMPHARRYGSHT